MGLSHYYFLKHLRWFWCNQGGEPPQLAKMVLSTNALKLAMLPLIPTDDIFTFNVFLFSWEFCPEMNESRPCASTWSHGVLWFINGVVTASVWIMMKLHWKTEGATWMMIVHAFNSGAKAAISPPTLPTFPALSHNRRMSTTHWSIRNSSWSLRSPGFYFSFHLWFLLCISFQT